MRGYAAHRVVNALATLGDNDYTESPAAFHRNWTEGFGWAARRGRIAGALGNHDIRVQGGRYEFDELRMPSRYYKRRIGDVAFVVLDSNAVGRTQTAWLRRALAQVTARWTVVAFHHPAFSCGAYRGHPGVVERWVPVFERYDVDLVLAGHDHNYQRFRPRNGVRYIVHGGGGASLYPIARCPAGYPRRAVARRVHGWLYLRSTGTGLRIKAVRPDGTVLDAFTIYP